METVQFLYAFDGIQKLDSTPNNSPRHTCASRHSTRVEKNWFKAGLFMFIDFIYTPFFKI